MLSTAKLDRLGGRRVPPQNAPRRSPFQTDSVRAKGRMKERLVFYAKAAVLGILLGMLAVLAVLVYRMASKSPYFMVKTVNVTGVRMLTTDQVLKIAGTGLTGNVFTRDLERVAARIEQNPWVESVSVRVKLPDIVEVAVKERVPVAAVEFSGKRWVVDEQGYLIEETGRVRPQLLITGLKPSAVTGLRVANGRLFDAYRAASLFRLDTVFGDMPVAVDVSGADRTVVHTAKGLVVKFGPEQGKWEEKFMEYLAVRGVAPDFAPGFAGFDLSFDNQVVATLAGGARNEKRTDIQGVI